MTDDTLKPGDITRAWGELYEDSKPTWEKRLRDRRLAGCGPNCMDPEHINEESEMELIRAEELEKPQLEVWGAELCFEGHAQPLRVIVSAIDWADANKMLSYVRKTLKCTDVHRRPFWVKVTNPTERAVATGRGVWVSKPGHRAEYEYFELGI